MRGAPAQPSRGAQALLVATVRASVGRTTSAIATEGSLAQRVWRHRSPTTSPAATAAPSTRALARCPRSSATCALGTAAAGRLTEERHAPPFSARMAATSAGIVSPVGSAVVSAASGATCARWIAVATTTGSATRRTSAFATAVGATRPSVVAVSGIAIRLTPWVVLARASQLVAIARWGLASRARAAVGPATTVRHAAFKTLLSGATSSLLSVSTSRSRIRCSWT
mmetsp:Transcript_134092/g.428468  ORF Transcript_134092/g.428468 Transcript_134092/m.428468 type:complete len:226 (-) Transcript_134092:3208-3885(-)